MTPGDGSSHLPIPVAALRALIRGRSGLSVTPAVRVGLNSAETAETPAVRVEALPVLKPLNRLALVG